MRKRKTVKKKTPAPDPIIEHKLGDLHVIDGEECKVRYVNAGMAWCFPTADCPVDTLVARHIAFARIDQFGKVTMI